MATPPSADPLRRLVEEAEQEMHAAPPPSALSTSSAAVRRANSTSSQGVTETRRSAPSTLQLQQPLFVLDKDFITPEDATKFHAQALRNPSITIFEVVNETCMDLIHMKIQTDFDQTVLAPEQVMTWDTHLDLLGVAELVMKYFGAKTNTSRTLAENFADVPFHFSLDNHFLELRTYLEYISVARE